MRATTLFAASILGCVLILVAPAASLGQFGGGKGGNAGGKGRFGGGGGMGMDSNALFDFYAKGQPYILISNVRFGQQQMMQYAQEKGITNGQLTRPQFIEYQEQFKAKMFGGGGSKGAFGPKGGAGGGMKMKFGGGDAGFSPGSLTPPAAPANPGLLNQLADEQFKRLDKDNDGKLNAEEMPPGLRKFLEKWDKNRDGFIDQREFREYYAMRLGGGGDDGGTKGMASIIIEEEELDRKVVVFRAGGAMPAGLPAWFKQLDKDQDGQVALYEWRKAGKDLDEFRKWDLNDDGFITTEEAVKTQAKLSGTSVSNSSGSLSASSSPSSERPQFGGFGKGGFGKGGFGGKGKGGYGKSKRDAGDDGQ